MRQRPTGVSLSRNLLRVSSGHERPQRLHPRRWEEHPHGRLTRRSSCSMAGPLIARALWISARSVVSEVRIVGDAAKYLQVRALRPETSTRNCGPLGGIHATLRESADRSESRGGGGPALCNPGDDWRFLTGYERSNPRVAVTVPNRAWIAASVRRVPARVCGSRGKALRGRTLQDRCNVRSRRSRRR